MVIDDGTATSGTDTVGVGRRRLAVGTAFAVAVVLLVTAAVLAVALPDVATAGHWSLAWSGLDVATAVCALATGALLLRHDPRAALTAGAAATLLVLDAWFDVTTASTVTGLWVAIGEAVLLELPLAALAARCATTWLRRPSHRVHTMPPYAHVLDRSDGPEVVCHCAFGWASSSPSAPRY